MAHLTRARLKQGAGALWRRMPFRLDLRSARLLLFLVAVVTVYNTDQAWQKTAEVSAAAVNQEYLDPSTFVQLPPSLNGSAVLIRRRTRAEPIKVETVVRRTEDAPKVSGRVAAAGLDMWSWFPSLTPSRTDSPEREKPVGDSVVTPAPTKREGSRSFRQEAASLVDRSDTSSDVGDDDSEARGVKSLPRALRSRGLQIAGTDLTGGTKRIEACPAEAPEHTYELAKLPQPQSLPTPDAPFLFLHNRKCGGSTLRTLVADSARAHNLQSYIPCFGPVHCETYDLRNMSSAVGDDVSVVAGHFAWDALESLGGADKLTCYSTIRDPVDMFVSYFYQRHPLAVEEKRTLSSLSPEELRSALDTIPEIGPEDSYNLRWWGELGGPANSAVKMMTASDISGHWMGADAADYAEQRNGRELRLEEAKRNLDRCVVGLLSDWYSTIRVLNHWFPWIQITEHAENQGQNRPSDEVLPEELTAIIGEYMELDLQLYQYGLEKFEAEKALLNRVQRAKSGCTVVE